MVGFYMAACARHGLPQSVSEVALKIGLTFDVAPRLTTSHMQYKNFAVAGKEYSFTHLDDEAFFSHSNTQAQHGFMQAAEALSRAAQQGLSHPATLRQLNAAAKALQDVSKINMALFQSLDVKVFYQHIRPYFCAHYVGQKQWRGANAGDIAAVNEIDLRLGLCSAEDPTYLSMVVEKFPFLTPSDRRKVSVCFGSISLLESAENDAVSQDTLNALFAVIQAYQKVSAQHHDMLVKKFITTPARQEEKNCQTTSGAELEHVVKSLLRLTNLRCAKPVSDHYDNQLERQRLAALRRKVKTG
jgi:hypothetical protein